MNKTEYLYECLKEECEEVSLAVSKLVKFGAENHHPDRTTTNLEELNTELNHVVAVVHMLREQNLINQEFNLEEIVDKIEQVKFYMDVSRKVGTLSD